jgi:hypothetical protein
MDRFASVMGEVAMLLLGDPNRRLSSKRELRFGSGGSISVDLEKGTFFDHEANEGGGVVRLIERETGRKGGAISEWLKANVGFVDDDDRRSSPPARRQQATNGNGQDYYSGDPGYQSSPSSQGPRLVYDADATDLGEPTIAYDYPDESGNLLYQVCRYKPKTFRPRHRSSDGRWINGNKGIRRVPYRLPATIEAIANGSLIGICEGEKDADNLTAFGLPTTCSAGGVGGIDQWRDKNFLEHFRDANVAVFCDNDPQARNKKTGELLFDRDTKRPKYPGQDFAFEICCNLVDVAKTVRLVDLSLDWPALPKKGDVSDWIEGSGRTIEQLYDVIQRTPDFDPDGTPRPEPEADLVKINYLPVTSWDGVAIPDREWIVEDIIPARAVTLLSGDGGLGKTLLVQHLAIGIGIGAQSWLGKVISVGASPVLLVHCEDDENEIHFRFDKIRASYNVRFSDMRNVHTISLVGEKQSLAVKDQKGEVEATPLFISLKAEVARIRPRVVVIDTAANVCIIDERDRSQVSASINLLRSLCTLYGCTVILLSHPSMAGRREGTGESGSTAWNNSVRSRLYLRSPKREDDGAPRDVDARQLEVMKSNYGKSGEVINLRYSKEDGIFILDSGAAKRATDQPTPEACDAFLKILWKVQAEGGKELSDKARAQNFAPKILAAHSFNKANYNFSVWDFTGAMRVLIEEDKIHLGSNNKDRDLVLYGPKEKFDCISAATMDDAVCAYCNEAGGVLDYKLRTEVGPGRPLHERCSQPWFRKNPIKPPKPARKPKAAKDNVTELFPEK